MATFSKFQQFVEDLASGVHDLGDDTLKLALSNTAPTAGQEVFAPGSNHPPPAAANGYTSGGATVSVTTAGQTSGTYTLAADAVVYTGTAGGLGPFRYPILYNDTPTSPADPLVSFWDHGESVTLGDGETFTVRFNNTDPGTILTIA